MPKGYRHLTYEQRCQIYALNASDMRQKDIAAHLGVCPSTISRELHRNQGQRGYRHEQAHRLATKRRRQASTAPKRLTPDVIELVDEMLMNQWSPEQISGRLKLDGILLSYERIYQYVWDDKASGGDLYLNLRRSGKKYNRRGSVKSGRGCIPNRVDIKERPAIVDKKSRRGDWEGDTIIGAQHKGAVVSLVERKSKFTKLSIVINKTAELVTNAIEKCFKHLPNQALRTITFDNGKEFAKHQAITEKTGCACYFATPYHAWERGLNEHTNGLVRQYLPKSSSFQGITEEEIQRIEDQLNNRPRKVLGFKTPREVFFGLRSSTEIALRG